MSDLAALEALLPLALIADRQWAEPRLRGIRQRLAQGRPVDRSLAEVETRLTASAATVARRTALPITLAYPAELPVSQRREEILSTLAQHRVVVLTGETGSGKTTQLPKMLLEAGYGRRGMIALTQPRRVAAVAMAARLREECRCEAGEASSAFVHSVRFDDNASADTLVRVMTDGLLLAEVANDPDLTRYDAIIVDEAHERSLNIDLLLGLLKLLRQRRPELAIVIASASIEAERFALFFSSDRPIVRSSGRFSSSDRPIVRSSGRLPDPDDSDRQSVQTECPPTNATVESDDQTTGRSDDRTSDPDDPTMPPIIQVSGRLYPVDIRYLPPADEDIGYLPAAVSAVRDLCEGAGRESGDVLVFLPTERDIIEAQRRLHDLPATAVLPLFGRLTPHEQQRVFQPPPGKAVRKVILATNIAETSLTIPGIRYVVDTGLSRFKRYQAASRTERLPIEAISQASATQRAGRAGRVEAGICIRLYSEEDFLRRDPWTAPEILRSNLAGVMITCLHLGFGDPADFPWLDAPAPGAWHQARILLDELGAIEAGSASAGPGTAGLRPARDLPGTAGLRPARERSDPRLFEPVGDRRSQDPANVGVPGTALPGLRLTPLGRTLAAIPADPQVARILIAGLTGGCAHEAATIAAFLSVQDPRVRPLGQEAKADAAQKTLAHEAGDLATILRLWDRWSAAASHSAKARLCEELYLGYRRMREWSDVRHQLWQALRERSGKAGGKALSLPAHGAEPERWPLDAVHKAVLAGLLGNVLMYDAKEKAYRAAGDRLLAVHPGSALKARETTTDARRSAGEDQKHGVRRTNGPPPWLVACEVVETSRLFARLCAPIDPLWVLDLAGDRVKRRHRDPQWHPQRKQVVVIETITWKGLPVRDGRLVPYDRIDPEDAERVFIRQGLCDDDGLDHPLAARNRALIRLAETLKHRLRDPSLDIDRSALAGWYTERIAVVCSPGSGVRGPESVEPRAGEPHHQTTTTAQPGVSTRPRTPDSGLRTVLASDHAFRELLKHVGESALRLTLADLVPPELAARAERGAPDSVAMGGQTFVLRYRFLPGDPSDGVTVELTEAQAPRVDPLRLDWLVPAWQEELVECYCAQLPKDQRRKLIPQAEAVKALVADLAPQVGRRPLAVALGEALRQRFGVHATSLDPTALPPHLKPRFVVRSNTGATVYDGRDPGFLASQAGAGADRLRLLRAEWETAPAATWPGDLPSGTDHPGGRVDHLGLSGFVALGRARDRTGTVAFRRTVYGSREAAAAWHEDGLDAGLEAALSADLSALATAPIPAELQGRCEKYLGQGAGVLRRHLALAAVLEQDRSGIRTASAWDELLARARTTLAQIRSELDPLLRRAVACAEQVANKRKQGARSLLAAQAATSVAQVVDRLLAPGWHQRLPWAASRQLDLLLTAQLQRLDGKGNPKAADRIAHLLSAYDEVLGGDPQRLLLALGLQHRARSLTGLLHVCIHAVSIGQNAGPAELRLRTGLDDQDEALGRERDRIAETRQNLIEASRLVPRIAVDERRERLGQEIGQALKEFPDLSLGADLIDQHAVAKAIIARIRAGL